MIVGSRRLFGVVASIVLVLVLGFGVLALRWAGDPGQSFDLSDQPERTIQLYRFVDESREQTAQIPCYCGCGKSFGHTSLLDCFVASDGSGFDSHASACVICTGEAEDVQRLTLEGMDTADIRTWIDAEYGVFGAPTDTA